MPEEKENGEDNGAEEDIVNTLDSEETAYDAEISDNEKMKELLDDLTQDGLTETMQEQNEELEQNTYELKEEDENMDDNVDLELLEALNADEENVKEEVAVKKENAEEEKTAPKQRPVSAVSDDEVTVIAKGTTISGSISSDGSLDIMGNVTGDIECLGKLSITGKINGNTSAAEIYVNTERMEGSITSEGTVKIGLGTVVIGDVSGTSGAIAGAVKGEIDINGPIVIDSTAIIKGNIKAKSVQINNGAVIEGFCSLSYSEVDVDTIFE
jgi:cytoskeletal protein CcmA (bactofilin family)